MCGEGGIAYGGRLDISSTGRQTDSDQERFKRSAVLQPTPMSETFDLYNFDHRLPGQGTFVIGPYSISVDAAQSENLVHLPKRAQISLGFDQNLRRVVTRTEPTAGEILPTATVRRPAPPARSELFPDRKAISADYDLILLLSFVTGRRVYLERDLCSDPRRSYSDRIVSHVFFQHVPMQFWEDRTRLSEHTLSDALYCVVNAALAPELIGRGAYVNAALDALITSWAKRTGQTKFPNRSSLDTTIKKLVEWMDARLLVSVRNKLARHFKLEGVSPNISDDIRARLRQISAGPSAIMKMTAYLQANQLFPEQTNRCAYEAP